MKQRHTHKKARCYNTGQWGGIWTIAPGFAPGSQGFDSPPLQSSTSSKLCPSINV